MNIVRQSWQHTTKFMREKNFSPLYQLRRNSFFVNFVIPRLDFAIFIRLYGVKWKVQVRFLRDLSWALNSKILSPELGALFLAINKVLQPDVFWDVGGNIGFYSWLLLTHNSSLKTVIFEADPVNIELIESTALAAKINNIQLINAAVSNESGKANFAIDKLTGATGTLQISEQTFIQRHYRKAPNLIEVKTVTLDQMWIKLGLPVPNLIKIDVEGAEKKVFDGAIELIQIHKPCLIFETTFPEKIKVIEYLKHLGYRLLSVEEINGTIETAYNLLALPPQYTHIYDDLITTWAQELQLWLAI